VEISYQLDKYSLLECIIQSICLIIIKHPELMGQCDTIIERATANDSKHKSLKLQVCCSIREYLQQVDDNIVIEQINTKVADTNGTEGKDVDMT